jgi:serine/threonine-protein kinase
LGTLVKIPCPLRRLQPGGGGCVDAVFGIMMQPAAFIGCVARAALNFECLNSALRTRWLQELTVIVGNYRIGRELAHGGMATVYRGIYRPTGMPVAIKVLTEESSIDEVLVHRMHQEARIQNILGRQHSGIVTCYEEIEVDDRPAMVLEYVPGKSVLDIIEDDGPLEPVAALDIILAALDALAHAHHHGIVHRDVKCENILVSPQGAVKLTDFGVARAEVGQRNARVTDSRDLVGTMVYMAPEQLVSPRTVDHRADLYGLGVTLFEMLTGEVPFDGEEGYPLMKRIELEAPPDPRDFVEDLDPCLIEVVMTALEKDPDERYFSAGEMDAALRRCRLVLTGAEDTAQDARTGAGHAGPRRGEKTWYWEPSEPRPLPEPRSFGYLVDLSESLVPGQILLRRAGLKIGRDPDRCDLIVPDDSVGPEHVLLLPLETGQVLLVDLLTQGRTTLNGEPVERAALESGDEFELSGRWKFLFER